MTQKEAGMMTNKSFEDNVKAARTSVQEMDAIDGFKDRNILAVLLAVECGLRSPELNTGFEAYVMLQDIVESELKVKKGGRDAKVGDAKTDNQDTV